MKLLVSVRSQAEARAALAGGADIIDAKEPAAGSLGPVTAGTLRAIREVVPPDIPLSAALGDVATAEDLARAMALAVVPTTFLKLGFRGVRDAARVRVLLKDAVRLAARCPGRPALVAVGYADHVRVGSLSFGELGGVVLQAGAGGVLVDTAEKDAGDLFTLSDSAPLAALGAALAVEQRIFALGGSLGLDQVGPAARVGASVFGVRGSACRGGRSGVIEQHLVARLAAAVQGEREAATARR